jgi:hypothetical protein
MTLFSVTVLQCTREKCLISCLLSMIAYAQAYMLKYIYTYASRQTYICNTLTYIYFILLYTSTLTYK